MNHIWYKLKRQWKGGLKFVLMQQSTELSTNGFIECTYKQVLFFKMQLQLYWADQVALRSNRPPVLNSKQRGIGLQSCFFIPPCPSQFYPVFSMFPSYLSLHRGVENPPTNLLFKKNWMQYGQWFQGSRKKPFKDAHTNSLRCKPWQRKPVLLDQTVRSLQWRQWNT